MTRSELEHVIRAAGAIAADSEIVIIGSQSILGQFPDAPRVLLMSAEADVYPLHYPDRADLIDGSIGEGSSFHESFGYYAQGVGEETATLPRSWQSRLISISNVNTAGTIGLCLEVHDLAISKYVAGREKDLEFTRELARHHLVDQNVLVERLAETSVNPATRQLVMRRIKADAAVRHATAAANKRPRKRS
jgi:hypothetical protein